MFAYRLILPIAKAVLIATAATATVNSASDAQILGPNLRMVITNATDATVEIRANGERVGMFEPFQSRQLAFRIFLTSGQNVEVSFTARVCSGTRSVSTIPSWASDVGRWGEKAALYEKYLESGPTEDDVRRRVQSLKRALDGAKVIGRDALKSGLDKWFDTLRETGSWLMLDCAETLAMAEPLRRSVHLQGGRREQLTVFVRNDRERYRISEW